MPKKTPSGRSSQACWDFERAIADAYRKAGFARSKRITRGSDFGASRPDVDVPEVPGMILDMKYKAAGWTHHTIFRQEIHERYVKGKPETFGVMHTKSGREQGSYVTVTLDVWLGLLKKVYLRKGDSRKWACPRCGEAVAKGVEAVPHLYSYKCNGCNLTFLSEDNHDA